MKQHVGTCAYENKVVDAVRGIKYFTCQFGGNCEKYNCDKFVHAFGRINGLERIIEEAK